LHVAGEEAVVDEGEKVHGYSQKQQQRVSSQVLACAQISNRLIKRYHEELEEINSMLQCYESVHSNKDALLIEKQNLLNDLIDKYHHTMTEIRSSHAMPIITQAISTGVFMGNVTPYSILKWWNQFKQHEKIFPDMRGKYEHLCALDVLNVGHVLSLYMSVERLLTVDKCVTMLTSLFNDAKFKDHDVVKKLLPLTRSTVHNWMLKYGASYDEHRKTYYTDRHSKTPDLITIC
jgi:hypothetical protein